MYILRVSSPGATIFPLKPLLSYSNRSLLLLFPALPRQGWITQGADEAHPWGIGKRMVQKKEILWYPNNDNRNKSSGKIWTWVHFLTLILWLGDIFIFNSIHAESAPKIFSMSVGTIAYRILFFQRGTWTTAAWAPIIISLCRKCLGLHPWLLWGNMACSAADRAGCICTGKAQCCGQKQRLEPDSLSLNPGSFIYKLGDLGQVALPLPASVPRL